MSKKQRFRSMSAKKAARQAKDDRDPLPGRQEPYVLDVNRRSHQERIHNLMRAKSTKPVTLAVKA